jgi:hypothetical protein
MSTQLTCHRPRSLASLSGAATAILIGCGGGTSGPATARAPSSAGEVWEVDPSADRGALAGALLAYVSGLHVVVLDGDRAYAGMTRLEGKRAENGARSFALASGLSAEVVKQGETAQLRFSSGEGVPLRRQPPRPQSR